MDKITLKALQLAGFQNANTIAEIISYVPNPQTAAEMLLGIYTPSVVDQTNRFKTYRYNRPTEFAEMLSINDLADTVTYRVRKQKTMTVWYLTEEDKKNKVYTTIRPEKSSMYVDYDNVLTHDYNVEEHTVSCNSFHSDWCNDLSVEAAHELMGKWMDYDRVLDEEKAINEL
jgi:hypothetical protein